MYKAQKFNPKRMLMKQIKTILQGFFLFLAFGESVPCMIMAGSSLIGRTWGQALRPVGRPQESAGPGVQSQPANPFILSPYNSFRPK